MLERTWKTNYLLDAPWGWEVAFFPLPQQTPNKGINSQPGLANRSIIIRIRAFPGAGRGVLRILLQ